MTDKFSPPARIVVADDHYLIRGALKAMLADEPDLEVVGEAQNGRETLALCRKLRPDLVLMDVRMPGMGNDDTPPSVSPPAQNSLTNSTLGASAVPVRLSWAATDSEGTVTDYDLQRSTDGGAYQNMNLPSATTKTVTHSLLSNHNYRYRVRATDDNGNRSIWKYGPRFAVEAHQESSAAIAYTGTWKQQSISSASGGAVKYATASGATAKLTFTGRNVAWVGPKSSTRGRAEVWLDGKKVATVDLYSATAQARKVIYAANNLNPSVTHTLQVKVLGTAGRPRVDVDAFVALR